jgi:hypothetical protein
MGNHDTQFIITSMGGKQGPLHGFLIKPPVANVIRAGPTQAGGERTRLAVFPPSYLNEGL